MLGDVPPGSPCKLLDVDNAARVTLLCGLTVRESSIEYLEVCASRGVLCMIIVNILALSREQV